MIKGISPNESKTTREAESDKPDVNTVSREDTEQFSSLMHKKKRIGSKKPSKSKNINKFLDKIESELAKQVGQTKVGERQSLGSKQARQSGDAESSADKQKSTGNDNLPQSLDAFDIAAMAAQNHAPLQSAAPPAEAAPAPPADLNKVIGEIADRILVSSAADNPAGMQEIRIHLKESVLPKTEVRIYRHAGSLQVEFVTNSKDSQMFIEQRQANIQKVLGDRLTDESVNVSVQDSQQTRGGQGEGRSRQQYINPEQDDD